MADANALRINFKNTLSKMSDQLRSVLPSSITPERFTQIAVTATQTNPDMLTATRESVIAELIKCARDGLMPDGREAFINCYGGKAVYMPMVIGYIKKVRLSGELVNMHPEIVHENDSFRYWIDDEGPHLLHEPFINGDRGEPTHAYVITNTKSEGRYIDVLSKSEIYKVRDASKAKNGPWNGNFALEMWKKTAIRRQVKRLPMNTDLENVVKADDEAIDVDFTKLTPTETAPKIESRKLEIAPVQNDVVESEESGPAPAPVAKKFTKPAVTPKKSEPAVKLESDPKEDRAVMITQCMDYFKELGFTPETANAHCLKTYGKPFPQLTIEELTTLYFTELAPEVAKLEPVE